MPGRTWKCVSTYISGGADISDVPGCHLLWQIGSQRGLQKLLQVLVPHELTAYLSDFDLFLIHWKLELTLSLLWKDSVTHMHVLAVYVKEGLPFAQDLSLENYAYSYLCFWLALLHSLSYLFFLYWSPSLSLFTVFDIFHRTTMRLPQSIHLLICLSLKD